MYEGRKRRFDRQAIITDAIATLTGVEYDEAVRFHTEAHFRALDIHNIIKRQARKRNMKVGVRVTDEWTYVWLKHEIK